MMNYCTFLCFFAVCFHVKSVTCASKCTASWTGDCGTTCGGATCTHCKYTSTATTCAKKATCDTENLKIVTVSGAEQCCIEIATAETVAGGATAASPAMPEMCEVKGYCASDIKTDQSYCKYTKTGTGTTATFSVAPSANKCTKSATECCIDAAAADAVPSFAKGDVTKFPTECTNPNDPNNPNNANPNSQPKILSHFPIMFLTALYFFV